MSTVKQQLTDLDVHIVQLLDERAELTARSAKLRQASVREWDLEGETLRHVLGLRRRVLNKEDLVSIYRFLFSVFASVATTPSSVACLGPAGSFTHLAASKLFGNSCPFVLLDDAPSVVNKLVTGEVGYAVVAVQNTIGGLEGETVDLLAEKLGTDVGRPSESALGICAELGMKVHYCLLGRGPIENVKTIVSHPQAFKQCATRLRALKQQLGSRLQRVEHTDSTADAARLAADDDTGTVAALAIRLSADLFPLQILQENMEDDPTNSTRFLVLGRNRPARTSKDRTSIWFRTHNIAGALSSALKPIAEHRLNMTQIVSRPVKNEPWAHSFFVELEGHWEDHSMQQSLHEMKASCLPDHPRLLGSYPLGVDLG